MSNVVNIKGIAPERLQNKQTAKYIVLTMLEVIKTEQKIIDDAQGVLNLYEVENEAINKAGAECLEEPATKELIGEFEKINKECLDDAMSVLNDLIEVLHKHKLMIPAGIYQSRDIRKNYEDIDK